MALDALRILIEGDPKEFLDAVEEVKKKSEDLEKFISSVAVKSSIAFAAMSGAIVGSLVAFRDSERTVAQLDATLKSTGFAAGLTSGEIQKMAGRLQQLTTFGDEAIISGQSILLKFRSIGKDGFEPASKAMLDMATAMQSDVPSAAQLLGKALENPQQGITLLTKAGVQFTDEQKKMIKTFDETGRAAEAQAIILKQVGVAFGGSAEAAKGGLGVYVQLKEALGDVAEGIGAQLAPAAASVGKVLLSMVNFVKENEFALKALSKILLAGAGMAGFIAAVSLGALAITKFTVVNEIAQIALARTATALNVSKIAVAGFIGAATLGIGLIIAFLPEIIAFATNLINAFTNAKNAIVTLMTNMVSNIGNILGKLGALLKDIFTFNFTGAADSAAQLKDSVQKAVEQTFKDGVEVKSTLSVGFNQVSNAEEEKKKTEDALLKAGEEARKAELDAEKKGGDEKLAEKRRQDQLEIEQEKVKQEILAAQRAGARDEVIKLKEQELALLKSLEDAKTASDREIAQIRLDQFRATEGEKLAEVERQAGLEVQANKVKSEIIAAEKRGDSQKFIKIKEEELSLIKALEDAKTGEDKERAQVQLNNFRAGLTEKVGEIQRVNDLEAEQEKIKRQIINAERRGASADTIKLKEEELALVKALEDAKDATDRERAALKLANFRAGLAEKNAEITRDAAIEAQIEQEKKDVAVEVRKGTKDEVIKIKEEEITLLKALKDAETQSDREIAQARLDEFRQKEDERIAAVLEKLEQERIEKENKKIEEREAQKAMDEEFATLDEEDRLLAQEKSLANLDSEQIARREALRAHGQEQVNTENKTRQQRISDEIKFGQSYAAINQALNSSQVQGVRNATSQLVELQNSRNSTLKGIGKAAAITQIGIDTAKSAMSIYAGFSTIPIIGPALGVAGAAAAIAFGLEKINTVRSAQDGGIVPGTGSGDIIPAFLEPGEIVVPKALAPTFAEQFSGLTPDGASIANRPNVTVTGPIIGTDSFVRENIIPAIRDAVQLENANIGVG